MDKEPSRHSGTGFRWAENREHEVEITQAVLDNIDSILLNGAKLIIDKVYDSIGFNNSPLKI